MPARRSISVRNTRCHSSSSSGVALFLVGTRMFTRGVLGIPPGLFPLGYLAFHARIGNGLARGFDRLRWYLAAVSALGFFTQVIGSSPISAFGPRLKS
jgi:hypothetical protein